MGRASGVRKMSAYIILGFLSYLAPLLKMYIIVFQIDLLLQQ